MATPSDDVTRLPADIVDLGPELFAMRDLSVISYKGENYYRNCGAVVRELEGGGFSHCVKHRNHVSLVHEDYFGKVKE